MKTTSFIIFLTMSTITFSLANAAEPLRFFVGTYTSPDGSRGIYTGQFDAERGMLEEPTLAAECGNPAFLAVHPSKPLLYAVGETQQGRLRAFQYDKKNGKLTPIEDKAIPGQGPCHLTICLSGNGQTAAVVVANYGSGSVASFPILDDGKIGNAASHIVHTGSGPNASRQRAPHAHGVYFDGSVIAVPDLGIDQVVFYKINLETAELFPIPETNLRLAPGAGPRHLAISKDNRFIYVVNELDSTVSVFDRQSTEISKPVQTVSTLDEGKDAAALRNTTAEIELHSSGKFLYASNRGDDSIAVFAVENGKLTLIQTVPSGGNVPRFFCLDPTGRFLLACNQNTGNICVFAVDQTTGKLTPTDQSVNVARPVCLVFALE